MGGIVAAEILPLTNITGVQTTSGTINVSLAVGASWEKLPIAYLQSSSEGSPEINEAGLVYQGHVSLQLLDLTTLQKESIRRYLVEGCLLKFHYSDGSVYVYGTNDYPMIGCLEEAHGVHAEDGVRWILGATNASLDGPLVPL